MVRLTQLHRLQTALLLSGTETTHHQMIYIYGILQHINLAHHALKTQVGCFNHGMVILHGCSQAEETGVTSDRF